jgi:hypothetical protein
MYVEAAILETLRVAWKEHLDPILRFLTEGDRQGLPFFNLTAIRSSAEKDAGVLSRIVSH